MNIGVHVSFWFMVFSGYMSSSGIAGSYGSFIPRFLRNLHAVLKVAISIHTLNEILLSLKKEWSWVSWTKVDKPRACYTGWSKSEKHKHRILIHMYGIYAMVKNLPANADLGLIPGSGRSPEGRHGNPFQYFVWRIPWIEEPGGL